jgi:hypothetical protein
MTWEMHDEEFAQVRALPAPERYDYFVKRVADWGVLWSLRSEAGWSMFGDADGREAVPVWPHARFAAACADGDWAGDAPAPIPLDDWLTKWIPGMARDRRVVAVFSVDGRGPVVEPDRLGEDLEAELARIE